MSRYYIPLPAPKVPGNAIIDTNDMMGALDSLKESNRYWDKQQENEMIGGELAKGDFAGAEKMAYSRGAIDKGLSIRSRRQSDGEHSTKEAQATAQRTAAYFQNFIEPEKDPTRQKQLVDAWVGSHEAWAPTLREHGIDPANHADVIRFVKAEAAPYMDQQDEAKLAHQQAQTAAEEARAGYYGARTDDSRGKSAARFQSLLQQVQAAETPWSWTAAQPAIQAAWGSTVPFEQRGQFLQQLQYAAQEGDDMAPSPSEADAGITRTMKGEAARQKLFTDTYGEPQKGYVWAPGENGAVVQRKITSTPDQSGQGAILDEAKRTITEAKAKLKKSNMAGRAWGQYWDAGTVGQSVTDIQQAAMSVVYALSGKQTAVAELNRFMAAYGPKIGDTEWRIDEKVGRLMGMLEALEDGKRTGIDWDENWARASLVGSQGGNDPAQPSERGHQRRTTGNTGAQGMSDEELLRALEQ